MAVSPPALLSSRHRCPRIILHSLVVVVSVFLVAAVLLHNSVFSSRLLPNSSPLLRHMTPLIVLLGDSITEYGANPRLMGYASMLANDYVRRADIVNRGAAGWTSRKWLEHFPSMIQDWGHNPPALVSIALGANDAALESDPVHVPVDEYASNLRDMVRQIRTAFPTCMIMLVTPPTVDDATCIWPRSNEQAGVYAQMCVQVGAALNVSVVDVWSAFLHENQQNRTTVLHVPDGLHLNGPGNMLLHDLWLAQVHLDMPQLSPRHLPIVFS